MGEALRLFLDRFLLLSWTANMTLILTRTLKPNDSKFYTS